MSLVSCRYFQIVNKRKRQFQLLLLWFLTLTWYLLFNLNEIPQWFIPANRIPLLDPDINFRLSKDKIVRNVQPDIVYKDKIWVILEVGEGPSPEIKEFCNDKGYTVLVLGNDLYKQEWGRTKCQFQSMTDQKKLNFKSSNYLDNFNNRSAVRKNIAILFAIQQGATVIYNLNTISDFVYINFNHKWCLRYTGPENFNPFHHFQIVNSGVRSDRLTYHLTECKQTVFSLLPSINTKTTTSFPSEITRHINQAAPSISVSRDNFFQFVPKSQIYHIDSFWSSVTFPNTTWITALFTCYWHQFLLHKVGQDVSVIPSENTIYTDFNFNSTDSAIYNDIFYSETCKDGISISQCAIKLANLLIEFNIWKRSNLYVLLAWFKDLQTVQYKLPVFETKVKETHLAVIKYSPKVALQTQSFTSVCRENVKLPTKSKQITDILLLIVFNHPIYKHVGLLHEIYSRTFTNIIYCGDNAQKFTEITQNLNYDLTFIEQDVYKGYFIYKCVSSAMKIDYTVSGILMLSDDVLLNSWNVGDLPIDRPWTGQLYRLRRGERDSWWNWRQWYGEQAFNAAWNEIISLQKQRNISNGHPDYKTDYLKLEKRLNILGNSSRSAVYGFEDITYFPRTIYKDVIYYGDIFAKHGVFEEIAIAVLVAGFTDWDDILMIPGSYLWDEDRHVYQNFFNRSHLFFHPYKWGEEFNKDFGRHFLCTEYFPYL